MRPGACLQWLKMVFAELLLDWEETYDPGVVVNTVMLRCVVVEIHKCPIVIPRVPVSRSKRSNIKAGKRFKH